MLSKQTFENINNKVFEILFEVDNSSSCDLIEISSPKSNPENGNQSFSLLFQSNSADVYPQGTYVIKNDEIPETALFLVPIATNDTGVKYEAIFSVLVE
jgi:hypothetical protein